MDHDISCEILMRIDISHYFCSFSPDSDARETLVTKLVIYIPNRGRNKNQQNMDGC